jgi:hypothetical protein
MTRQATMPSSSQMCLRISKTESYGLSRICYEMTRQATMTSSSQKCLRVSKTESYGLSRICFEMMRQATMPSLEAWLCLADKKIDPNLILSFWSGTALTLVKNLVFYGKNQHKAWFCICFAINTKMNKGLIVTKKFYNLDSSFKFRLFYIRSALLFRM